MEFFFSDFHGTGANGLPAEQYFYKQVFENLKENTQNGTLPFFNKDLNKIPRELSTGKIINNENSVLLEQIASRNGYKSNIWIYGNELNKIQKEVGNLYCKKGAKPALCLTKYFGETHLNEQDLYVSEGGSGKKEQYLYNLDSLDGRSREKVMKYYEIASEADRKYTQENLKAFKSNCERNSKGQNDDFKKARERTLAKSSQAGIDLSSAVQCHYLHNLANSIGQPRLSSAKTSAHQNECYESCKKMIEKVESGKLKPEEAGKMLCSALNAGTEFQRISVSKGYNLENAKKIEEMKVAEANRNRAYRRSSGFER